jgi:hypothetical protein
MYSSSLRVELRCSRMAVFFSLKPKSDYITFIAAFNKIIAQARGGADSGLKALSTSINISIEC